VALFDMVTAMQLFSHATAKQFQNNFKIACCALEELLYREAESYVSHHKTSKHQCTHLGSVPNLNSKASSPFYEV